MQSKVAKNIIVIGGPIAAGKSTLAGSLGHKNVQELDPNDELQNILLSKMYKGDKVASQIFQVDLLISRHHRYKKAVKSGEICIFDRSILEDRLFAESHLKENKNILEFYDEIWNNIVEEMKSEFGLPSFYFLLNCSWESFEKRIFKRNRKSEIQNWEKNKDFFKEMLDVYNVKVEKMLIELNIPYVIIDTDKMTINDMIDFAKTKLVERGIYE